MINGTISKIEAAIDRFFSKKNTNILLTLFLIIICILHVYFALHRNAFSDENLYIHEAKTIYRQLSNNEWFGAEFTGTHGFLSKFIVALFYFIIGKPLPFIASFFTILISIIGTALVFRISQHFFSNSIALIVSVLYSGSTYIFITSHSFLREIYVTVAVLLFIYWYLRKKKDILLSLSLLLILDGKECVFFILSVPILTYLLIEFFFKKRELGKVGIKSLFLKYIKKTFIIFSLPIIYLLLMVFTSIIPYNSYTGRVLLVSEGRLGKLVNMKIISNADPVKRDVEHLIIQKIKDKRIHLGKLEKTYSETSSYINLLSIKIKILNLKVSMSIMSSIIKIRRFTIAFRLIALPLFILLSSLMISMVLLCNSFKKKKMPLIMFSLMFIFFIIVGFMKFGTSRYYTPVIFFMAFFSALLFTKNISSKNRLLILYSILFIITISPIINVELADPRKIIIFIILAIITILTIYFEKINKNRFAGLFYLASIAIITTTMSIGFSFMGGSHLYYKKYGENYGFNYFVEPLNKIYNEDKSAIIVTNLSENQFLCIADIYSAFPYYKWSPKEKIKKIRRFNYRDHKVTASVDFIHLLSNDSFDITKLIEFMVENKSNYLFIHHLFNGKWERIKKPIFDLIMNTREFEVIYYRNDKGKNEGAILKFKNPKDTFIFTDTGDNY